MLYIVFDVFCTGALSSSVVYVRTFVMFVVLCCGPFGISPIFFMLESPIIRMFVLSSYVCVIGFVVSLLSSVSSRSVFTARLSCSSLSVRLSIPFRCSVFRSCSFLVFSCLILSSVSSPFFIAFLSWSFWQVVFGKGAQGFVRSLIVSD